MAHFRLSRSRRRRAFSLLEVAVATSLFSIVAVGVSLAVSSALSSRAASAIEFRLQGEMDKALIELSYVPFEEILANEFTPPSPCPDASLEGTGGQSCFTVADRDFTVSWSTVFATDAVESSTEAVDSVVLVATVSLPDGSVIARSRRVAAPTPGFNGDSLLRAQFAGSYEDLPGPVFLVQADSPTSVVSSATVSSYGSALFRVPPDSCTVASPCRLALSPSNYWSSDGSYSLSPASSIGDGAKISLTPGKVFQIGAEIAPVATLDVSLIARGDTGKEAPPTVENSVCLWASFNDGVADRLVPACNSSSSSAVSFSSYAVDPGNPTFRARLTGGVEVRLFVDRPNGTCPDLGQVGASAGVWEPAAVCTSWTWGVPSTLTLASGDVPFSTPVRVGSAGSLKAVWTGELARPAVGFEDRPLWMNPRAYGACAASASCTPSFNSAPETGLCNDALCFSARVPSLLGPSTGSANALAVSSTTSQFDLTVVDEYGDPVQVQLLAPPQSGSLFFDDEELSAGDVLGSTEGPGPGSFELTFVEDSQIDMVFFTVRLSNEVDDGVRDVDVALYRNARPWFFSTREVSLAQDGSATVAFSMIGTDSQPADFEQVSLSAPLGLTSVSSATSDATGRVQFTLAAGAVAAGSYSIDLETPSGRTASIPVVISQTAGSVTVTAQDLSQGTSASASVLVRDRVSAPMESTAVSFATSPTGFGFALGVRTSPSGCFTDGSGSCSVLLIAEPAASGGAYVLTARSGSLTATDSFSVASVPSRLVASSLTLPQSGIGSWSLTVKDGAGSSLSGRTVSVVSTPTGVSLTPSSLVSSAGGVVSFSVSVANSTQPGPVSVSFTVDSVPVSASFMVDQSP